MNSRVAVILLSCTASCYGGILRANMVSLPNGAIVPSGASSATYNSGASISTYSATAQAPNLVTLANGAIVPSDNSDVKAAKLAHAQAGGAIEPASGASYVAGVAYSGALAGTPSLVTL